MSTRVVVTPVAATISIRSGIVSIGSTGRWSSWTAATAAIGSASSPPETVTSPTTTAIAATTRPIPTAIFPRRVIPTSGSS
jgi:hypothetical protein